MQTIIWFASILAVFTGLKFVYMVFKRLGSKNSMNDVIDRMEDGMANAADTVAGYWKKSKKKRMAEKRAKKKMQEQPIVTIR